MKFGLKGACYRHLTVRFFEAAVYPLGCIGFEIANVRLFDGVVSSAQ